MQKTIHAERGSMSSAPDTATFRVVFGSLIDSLVTTFFYITFLPAFLQSWQRVQLFHLGCLVVLAIVLLDSGPRVQFFSLRYDRGRIRAWLCLAATTIALYLEVLCIAVFAATGYPACECFLISCFLMSSLARMLYRSAGGPLLSLE